jgi:hypothetical protein
MMGWFDEWLVSLSKGIPRAVLQELFSGKLFAARLVSFLWKR